MDVTEREMRGRISYEDSAINHDLHYIKLPGLAPPEYI